MSARTFKAWRAYEEIEPWRLEDEPARRYPLPKPETVVAKLHHFGALISGLQHRKR